jgi:antitoxin CptB
MTVKSEETERKRLIFRAWHRGTREMDLIMGRFADETVPELDQEGLAQFSDMLNLTDPQLYDYICGREQVPANLHSPILQQLLDYYDANRASTHA